MPAGSTRPAAWLSAKGRVRALFDVIADGEDFWLLGADGDGDYLKTELGRYVLRADVSFECPGATAQATLGGCDDAWLAAHAGELIAEAADGIAIGEVRRNGDVVFARTGAERIEVIAPAGSQLESLATLPDCTPDQLARMAIAEGRAAVPAALREQYIPQMLNLERIGAVSFTKGCYPGQEIVARTQNLGTVKRRLARFALADGERPDVGAGIVDASGAAAGEINRIAATAAGYELLAVTPVDAGTGTLALASDGRPLT